MSRTLIVNADDLGLSEGVNRGILDAHRDGIVTSATLMVRQPAAEHAAELVAANPSLCVGLHVDLGEWAYEDGEWVELYGVVDTADADAVTAEVESQVARFIELVGRPPSHLDSHQHVHRSSPVDEAVTAAGRRLGVPVRGRGIRYVGDFYGQLGTGEPHHHAITVDGLVALLLALPEGVSELGCHPGYDADGLRTMYRTERHTEVATLCDPRVRAVLRDADIELRSFCGL